MKNNEIKFENDLDRLAYKYSRTMNKLCGIYSISCCANNKQYIGSSIDIGDRWRHHMASLIRNSHGNNHLQRIWNKYGSTKFIFKIIELCHFNELVDKELFWIRKLNPVCNLKIPNLTHEGWIFKEETRKKMSQAAKGHIPWNKDKKGIYSEETLCKISEGSIGNQNAKGWTPTQDQKRKMREARLNNPIRYWLGKNRSEETKKKISQTLEGRIQSDDTKRKRSRSLPSRKLSDEQVLVIRERALTGENQFIIAKDFKIAHSTVSSIKTGRVRKWLWKQKI